MTRKEKRENAAHSARIRHASRFQAPIRVGVRQ